MEVLNVSSTITKDTIVLDTAPATNGATVDYEMLSPEEIVK